MNTIQAISDKTSTSDRCSLMLACVAIVCAGGACGALGAARLYEILVAGAADRVGRHAGGRLEVLLVLEIVKIAAVVPIIPTTLSSATTLKSTAFVSFALGSASL